MAITDLRVADEVTAQLGAPTVESLRTRLSQHARCPDCQSPLGPGPVAVIGQQVEDRAVLFGAHPACRASTWIRADETGELNLPLPLGLSPQGSAIGLGIRHPPPRGLRWLRRWISPMVPTLVAFPEPEWAWVRLVGPGETVNDDLGHYREMFGLASDPRAEVPRVQGVAWLDGEEQLTVALGKQRFAGPVDARIAAAARTIGAVQLVLVSGVDIGPQGDVRITDVYAAAAEGRAASGWLPLGTEPAADEPDAEIGKS